MPDTPSITIVKSFTYRNAPEEYANTYHFAGDTPDDEAAWESLAVAIWNEERKMLNTSVSLSAGYGYEAGNESSVWQYDFADDPPANPAGVIVTADQAPGDAAVWVRWKTPDRNSKGRPIYLRKYFHGFGTQDPDGVGSATAAAMLVYGEKMKDGTLPGGFTICGPQGAAAGAVGTSAFVGFRQLKRTGKRPTS